MADEDEVATIDCQGLSTRDINDVLRAAEPDKKLRLENVSKTLHGFSAGAVSAASIESRGSLGDFVALLGELSNLDIYGKVGDSLGHSLVAGQIIIRGSAGDHVGAFATGGLIVVLGPAGDRCGYALQSGNVFVRGPVGDEAACCMRGGDLILGNGAGENTGCGMCGGNIYVRGEVKSLSPDIRLVRMKDADSMRLSLLLARAGIKGNVKEFRAYRSRVKQEK